MSILLPGGHAWLVANWVSFGFFHDARKYLREGSRLARDVEFCIGAEVDTLDARTADEPTLVELNDIVGRVVRDNRAAGPAAFHDPAGYPVYMEKLAALETEVAAALANCRGSTVGGLESTEPGRLRCRLYVDTSLDRDALGRWIARRFDGKVEEQTVTTSCLEIDVTDNLSYDPVATPGGDPLSSFRYVLEVEALAGAQRVDAIEAISLLLRSLWGAVMRAEVACDFADEVPTRGSVNGLTVDEWLMVPYEQIDFKELTNATVLRLAVQNIEPFVATTALGELAIRRAPEVREAALAILSAPWDRYLTAYALTCLFDRDFAAGMVEMERLLADCRDPVVLEAMIENVLSEAERFAQPGYAGFAHALARRVLELDPAEFKDREERDEFVGVFGARNA